MFNKVLIANRGEIACRVIKTAKRLGIATVSVYSDADRDALHVRSADEAIHIGPAPARESYLQVARILEAAKISGADAIHPGYGFLSENSAFARACADNGLAFIGPGAEAIDAMGSKSAAKQIMEKAGVPLVPGYHGADQDAAILKASADSMGYPVLLKATAGGGGKGMRQVWSADEFEQALAAAKRESLSSFNDDNMLVEKYLTRPRHVEVQVFCDNHGNAVYLAERDCSVQRRHQKVIEEAPAPGISEELRKDMGEAAVKAALAINYRGAGTVEFLLDEDGSYYFMEMNTRLQVEHPVTECITGQDLVEWQLLVAAGETLPLAQDEIQVRGHAFEARIYAEDPGNNFLPVTGTLDYLKAPEENLNIRIDTGVCQGDEISVHYDPMIAKLIVWDESRERALRRLITALANYRIGGTVTNVDFLYNLASTQPFLNAELDTGFIERHSELIFRQGQLDLQRDLPLAALALLLDKQQQNSEPGAKDHWSPWNRSSAWRLNEPHRQQLILHYHGENHTVIVEHQEGQFHISAAGNTSLLRGELDGDDLQIERDGHRQRAQLARTGSDYILFTTSGACHFRQQQPDTGESDEQSAEGGLAAPMNGTVVSLLAEPGVNVDKDTPLLIMEAMKMEHTIRAPAAGSVELFYFAVGDLVDGGALLLKFSANDTDQNDTPGVVL